MTTQEFVFDLPLYTRVKLSEGDILNDLTSYSLRVDGYNPLRGVDSTFRIQERIDPSYVPNQGTGTVCFECVRYNDSMYVMVHFDRANGYIEKVGQYPSVADIHIAQVKQYKKVLGETYIRDFTKAIGLAANGVGTGSFVYLRRVFEHLVSEIAEEAIENGKVDREKFVSSKMENKLKLLSDYLPEIVLENKHLYGVLSAGIHELSEEQCLAYFSIVRTVVELMLDEREHERFMFEKKKKAKKGLGNIAGEVKDMVK